MKREAGLNPARSRHCEGEPAAIRHRGGNTGRRGEVWNLSQETCLFCFVCTHDGWGLYTGPEIAIRRMGKPTAPREQRAFLFIRVPCPEGKGLNGPSENSDGMRAGSTAQFLNLLGLIMIRTPLSRPDPTHRAFFRWCLIGLFILIFRVGML